MNTSGLPTPTAATPATPAGSGDMPPTVATAGVEAAPTDFMMALTQMLVGNAATQAPVVAAAGILAQQESSTDKDEPLDPTDGALAFLPINLQMTLPQQPIGFASGESDPLEMLGLNGSSGPSARDLALLQSLTERLAQSQAGTESAQTPETLSMAPNVDTNLQAKAAQTAEAAAPRSLHAPVGTSAWADELGSRVTLMTERGQHTASLRLSPEHLGPLEVRISMRDDQASVWFGAAHADTRAAIEHALPRLREMFAAQGLSLADAGVFREPPRQQSANTAGSTGNGESERALDASTVAQHVKLGLVDAYA